MSSVKILHTADLHIGAELSALGSKAESRQFEVLETFKDICTLCRENNVEICLISGDLFDSNRSGSVLAPSVLSYIESASPTRFFYVAGNHDPLDASSPFKGKLPSNLTVCGNEYETVVLDDLNTRICGKSFSHSSMDFAHMPPMEQDGLINILLLHADTASSDSRYNPITKDFIEGSGADYIALGHIHKRSGIERLGKSFVSYCGTPEPQGFDEDGEKGIYIGTVKKGEADLSFKRTARRIYATENIDISAASSSEDAAAIITDTLIGKYGESYKDNLYKIILSGTPESTDSIRPAQIELALQAYYVKIKPEFRQRISLELLSEEPTLKGFFVKEMLNKISAAEAADKQALFDALYLGLSAFEREVTFRED